MLCMTYEYILGAYNNKNNGTGEAIGRDHVVLNLHGLLTGFPGSVARDASRDQSSFHYRPVILSIALGSMYCGLII